MLQRRLGPGEIGLVDRQHVGDLQDARLDGLHVVAQPRGAHDDPHVRRVRDVELPLAGADGLDDDAITELVIAGAIE